MGPPPSYWACKRRIRILRKYQDLVRHQTRSQPDVRFADKLEDLIGPFKDPVERIHLLEREIARLSPIVFHLLDEVGIPTIATYTVNEMKPAATGSPFRMVPRKEDRNILVAYLQMDPSSVEGQNTFDLVMTTLEEGIGMYQSRERIAFREIFYPTVWLAYLIRLPITVLERAGLITDGKTGAVFIAIYAGIVKVLVLVILGLIAARLGFITWKDFFQYVFKHQ